MPTEEGLPGVEYKEQVRKIEKRGEKKRILLKVVRRSQEVRCHSSLRLKTTEEDILKL